jgi:hypothetical protein
MDEDLVSPLLLKEWLAGKGFLDNPFDEKALAAETDEYLPDCFVEFPYFEEVLGNPQSPGPRFILTERGGGKTALRLQIERGLDKFLEADEGRALAVTCDQFDVLCERVGWDTTKVTLRMHIEQIVGLIVSRLFVLGVQDKSKIQLRALGDNDKRLLRWYIDKFSPCLQPWQLSRLLGKLEGIFYFVNIENVLKGTQTVTKEMAAAIPGAKPVVETLLDIVSWKPHPVEPKDVPGRDLLKGLIEICKGLNLDAIYVLVDNVDQAQYAGVDYNFAPAFHLIRSLGAARDILLTSGLVVKFFLPTEILELAETSFRFDVLRKRCIEWDREALSRVLQKRLATFSGGTYRSLSPLCQAELNSQIDDLLLDNANMPRDLLRLGNELFAQHFKFRSEEPELTADDWQKALNKVTEERQRQRWRV